MVADLVRSFVFASVSVSVCIPIVPEAIQGRFGLIIKGLRVCSLAHLGSLRSFAAMGTKSKKGKSKQLSTWRQSTAVGAGDGGSDASLNGAGRRINTSTLVVEEDAATTTSPRDSRIPVLTVANFTKTWHDVPDAFLDAIYALCWVNANKGKAIEFLGPCVAIAPKVVLSAGHHYNDRRDEVDSLCVAATHRHMGRGLPGSSSSSPADSAAATTSPPCQILGIASWAQKSSSYDVLILWLDRDLPFLLPLRAYVPRVGALTHTVWLHPDSFNTKPAVLSPGVVVSSSDSICETRATLTKTGCSGAPVFSASRQATPLVGLHLARFSEGRVCTTEFVPTKAIVHLLSEAGVDIRAET